MIALGFLFVCVCARGGGVLAGVPKIDVCVLNRQIDIVYMLR